MWWLLLRTYPGVSLTGLSLLALALTGCKGDSTGPAEIASVLLTPEAATLETGQTLRLSAQIWTVDGKILDRPVSWRSSDSLVADVDRKGRVTGTSEGWATVSAAHKGMEGTASIRVVGPGAYNCSHQAEISQPECWALVALYDTTNGEGWRDSAGWLMNDSPCGWEGVSCDGGSVTRLTLGFNDLAGPIPAELKYLSALEVLELGSNQLTGSIPAELGSLSNLEWVWLADHQLSEEVPVPVAQMGGRLQATLGSSHCSFSPPGNEGLLLPDTQEYRDADLDADGLICGLAFTVVDGGN